MGRDAAKACENQCFRCRKEAAKYNDKLGSREGAAELLGISVSSLADYELGNTKVIPVDKVVLMADIYNAPELMAWYCSSECLIGKSLEMPSPEIASVERTTMKLLKQLRQGDIEQVKEMFRLPSASTSAPMPGLRWRNGTTPIMSSTSTWAGGKEPDTLTSCVRSWKASWRERPSG